MLANMKSYLLRLRQSPTRLMRRMTGVAAERELRSGGTTQSRASRSILRT